MYDLKNMIKGIKNRYYGTSILGWCFILSLHLILCSCSSVQKRADASNQTVNETNNISTNPTLGRTSTIEKNIDKINWYFLSSNSHAIHLLKKYPDYIHWESLSKNKYGMSLLKENTHKINWSCLCLNPSAISLIEQNLI